MITRGYFIGEIIDELANIANQVDNRCKLGLTDLNKYLEDFFKEILNILLGIQLENLNNGRSNAPGLDLGDSVNNKAFQITSEKTSTKINDTLNTVLDNKIKKYDDIYILIIGYKQKSYTENKDLWDKLNFKKENIWDINTLCKKAIELPLDKLQAIHQYIKQEIVRVKIELEIPNQEGEFATNIKNYIEAIAKPKFNENQLKVYYEYHINKLKNEGLEADDYYTFDDIKQAFDFLAKELAKLPRITREFYAFLLERRDENSLDTSSSKFCYRFNKDRLRRICSYGDIDGEIRLLTKHEFISWDNPTRIIGEDYYTGWTESSYRIYIPGDSKSYIFKNFIVDFVDFIDNKNIGYQKPIVNLDFSDF
ncbi:SMEK domain-containing protein [Anabaena cylindrica UHCC 0172]|uniref:SMEK domain-containing protein n=1 Tax=Anabaena cylindrica TaxID=1165 RepID=UPI002B216B58|nr:SMEK domain-containing protein [Anabaena cylindrica]MEA5550242.1 SMEK domain-containing protein [Anabaena cylindrica UHCC 0172]